MENGPRAFVLGVGTVDLKLTLGTNVHGRDVPHVPIHIKTSSKALPCREGLKLVLESNEFVIFKFVYFVGKGYESGGMFRLSTIDFHYRFNVATCLNKCEACV
jgi:hypothetical protein